MGAGGFAPGNDTNSTGGFDVYVISNARAESPALFMARTGQAPILPDGYTHISEVLWFVSITKDGIRDFIDMGQGRCRYFENLVPDEKQYKFTAVTAEGYGTIPFNDLIPATSRSALLRVNVSIDPNASPGSWVQFFWKLRLGLIETLYPVPGLPQQQKYSMLLEVPIINGERKKPIYYRFSSPLNRSASNHLTATIVGWQLPRAND